MKKVIGRHTAGRHTAFIFGILLSSTFTYAQIDIYRYHSSFIPAITHKKSQQQLKVEAVFEQNRPFFLQYIPKHQECFFLDFAHTSYCFNREINMDGMSRKTKLLFFKMKMWQYFR